MEGNWNRKTHDLKAHLAALIPKDELRRLHHKRVWVHFAYVARQVLILAASSAGAALSAHPLVWVPCAIVSGFTFFNFTVLLHDLIHDGVTVKRHDRFKRVLGGCYAFPSGISQSQFERWHLDHHAELGSPTEDPKRFYLSPKRNERWYKLLYYTPALFFIYFRAAARETATYPEALRRRIARERTLTVLGHLAIATGLGVYAGPVVLWHAYLVPYLFVFPVAFALNRLGQHYAIDPSDPAKWSTLIRGNWFWDFAFLNSDYHLEHHYFPNVPLYNLPRLQRVLWPFYESIGFKPRGYGQLFWDFIVRNRPPHANWATSEGEVATAATARG